MTGNRVISIGSFLLSFVLRLWCNKLIILPLIVMIGAITGCSLGRQKPLTYQDFLVVYLVATPYLLGAILPIFFVSIRTVVKIVMVLIVSLVGISMAGKVAMLVSQLPAGPSLGYRMVAFWMFLGLGNGYVANQYIRTLGFPGYSFVVCVGITGACLSSLIVKGLVPLIQHGQSVDTLDIIKGYGVMAILFALSAVGTWRMSFTVLKTAIKNKLLVVFSVLGALDFAIKHFYHKFLSDILWWLPIDPPLAYTFFFSLIIGAIGSLPVRKLVEGNLPKVDEATGLSAAMAREKAALSKPLPLTMVPFTYKVPDGWTVERREDGKERYYRLLLPPAKSWSKRLDSRLDFMVAQYLRPTETDPEKLRRHTHINLLARDASLTEEKIGRRYGVLSHECLFQQGKAQGYVVSFIIHSNEFVIHWLSLNIEDFNKYIRTVNEFIDGFSFDASTPSGQTKTTIQEGVRYGDLQTLEAYVNKGITYVNKGKLRKAINVFTKVINLDSTFADAFYNRGNAYFKKLNYDDAIADYTKAIEINSNYTEAYYNRGLSLAQKGNLNAAIDDYTKALQLNHDFGDAYYNRGIANYKKGNLDAAINDYTKAIEINANYAEAYNRRGKAYSDRHDFRSAEMDFTKAIELNPQFADAFYNRGLNESEQGNNHDAIRDYSKAIEINPRLQEAYVSRGIATFAIRGFNIKQGKKELDFIKEAILDFTAAILLNPNCELAYHNRSVMYRMIGNIHEANEDYKKSKESIIRNMTKIIALNPNDAVAYNKIGDAFYSMGDYVAAIEHYSKAISLNPNYAEAYRSRGVAYVKIGNSKMANDDIEKYEGLSDKGN